MTQQLEILLIEDDKDIQETVCTLLESEGYHLLIADNGKTGLELFSPNTQLVILDIMMPGMSGYDVCKKIRETSCVPILFLTAKSGENDKLIGFRSGGDDYLTKPFSYMELSARVAALLRRYRTYNNSCSNDITSNWLEMSSLRINLNYNQVYRKDQEIELTDTEYGILLLLMKHPHKIFSIQNIYESIWNEPYYPTCNNSVMVHIRNLRCKLECDHKKNKYILTEWGKGYRFGYSE